MRKLRVLDLFSGIGGFSLGLERTGGFETVAFCEIEPFPRKVLAKHWPGVPIYDDVRTLTADTLSRDGISVDVICGGFPCQDISTAGKGAGLAGERSGLWSEIVRLASELRPQFIIVENVAALLSRGLGTVLGDLAEIGFDAEWDCIPAVAVGAPHRRDRIWIVAYANAPERGALGGPRVRMEERPNCVSQWQEGAGGLEAGRSDVGHADNQRQLQSEGSVQDERGWAGDAGSDVAHTERRRLESGYVECARTPAIVAAAYSRHRRGSEFGEAWRSEPDVGRVAHGVPLGMDRLAALGNAVVPQIPEIIGRAILQSRAA